MIKELFRTSIAVAFIAVAGVALSASNAHALTSEQSDAIAAADAEGSQALATQAAALALQSPNDWQEILEAAIAADPDAAALIAATMASVLPVLAVEIAGAAGAADDPLVGAAVAAVVPAASNEINQAFPNAGSADSGAVDEIALLARKNSAKARQLAAVAPPNTRVTIAGGNSELQDGVVPSPN